MADRNEQLEKFLTEWTDTAEGIKKAFESLADFLGTKPGLNLEFIPRPGLTYSLRAGLSDHAGKPMFAMIDVIEGEPRWLSVCFYNTLITDPEELGDFVPGGLLGEDARCFDMESYSDEQLRYLKSRLQEAYSQKQKE